MSMNPPEVFKGNTRHDALRSLMESPLYQVRRVLRVTQAHWDLPLARGKRGARLARRERSEAPLLMLPRPGAFSGLMAA